MTLPRWGLPLVLLSCAGTAATAAPRMWLDPSPTADADRVPVVDGRLGPAEAPEYVQGRWFTLANWRGDDAPNGTMYMQVQDAIAAPMPLHPRALFVGLRLPRRLHESESDDTGVVTLFLDADRVPLTALRTGWPNADRRIVLTYRQAGARDHPNAPIEVTASEAYATSAGGATTAEITGANRMLRSAAIAADGAFLFLELRVDLPQSAFDDRRIGFALDYRDEGYATNQPVFTVPNSFAAAGGALRFRDKTTWVEIDLVEPASSTLGVGIYNAGQMVAPAGDGGEGEPLDVARAIAARDLVCLTEVMHQDDRQDVFVYANRLRAQEPSLLPFEQPVTANPGDPPNNMILTSWFVVASQAMRFAAIRPDDRRCTDAEDELVFGSPRGSKGVVWARIAAPVCRATQLAAGAGGCLDENLRPERPEPSPDEWFDVFCTHTQAPYRYEGDGEDARDCQFTALERFMTDRRSQSYLGRSGLDRPAILLGDLNQVGPRSLPDNDVRSAAFRAWKNDASDVYASPLFGAYGLKSHYQRMRHRLGNAEPHPFDDANDEAIEDYDLSADTGGHGSWIGAERGSTVSATTANDCTPGTPGFPDLRLTPRVDYVMLVPPAKEVYPAWAFRWDPAHPPKAFVDRHHLGGDAVGCVSDHAEVSVHLRPLRLTDVPPFNPMKSHQIVYRVTYLADVYGSDGNDTDWYGSTAVRTPRGNVENDWSDDDTEDCPACDPRWATVGAPFTGLESATVSARVRDWDALSVNDQYDADPAPGCREPSFSISHASGAVHRTSCGRSPVYVGSLEASGVLRGPPLWTVGNGDNGIDGFTGAPLDVAAVKHEIQMCEVGLRSE
jgi:hypothetical protein